MNSWTIKQDKLQFSVTYLCTRGLQFAKRWCPSLTPEAYEYILDHFYICFKPAFFKGTNFIGTGVPENKVKNKAVLVFNTGGGHQNEINTVILQ